MGRRLALLFSATAGAAAVLFGAADAAAADVTTWSAAPSAGHAGTSVRVASATDGDCTWLQPVGSPDSGELQKYDGTRVDVALAAPAGGQMLGSVAVRPGGTWQGSVTVPDDAIAGNYELVATCVVDSPQLDGLRTYELEHRTFVVQAPAGPPDGGTTTGEPPGGTPVDVGPPPLVVSNVPTVPAVTKVALPVTGPSPARAAATPRPTVATLPNTGSGTLPVALAGFGALGIGALAVWYGTRRNAHGVPPRLH